MKLYLKNILAVHQTVSTEKKICTRKVDELMEFTSYWRALATMKPKKYTHKRFLNLAADLIDGL